MYLYLIGAFDFNDILLAVKIGVTEDVTQRIASMQTGQFCEMKLILAWEVESRKKCFYSESVLHEHYQKKRIRGEWFRVGIMKDAVHVVSDVVGSAPCSVPDVPECLKQVQDGIYLKRALRRQLRQAIRNSVNTKLLAA